MIHFDDLGFAHEYEIDGDVEYPGDGVWGNPVYRIEDDGERTLQRGGPIALVTPNSAEPWVLSAGFQFVAAIYGTPHPDKFCVVEQFAPPVMVSASRPLERLELDVRPVRIASNLEHALLLFGEWTGVKAYGREGRRWDSGPLFDDDLKIVSSRGDHIVCEGTLDPYKPGAARIILDARTGEVVSA